jgi:hypothetical protein
MTHYGRAAKQVLLDNCDGWDDLSPGEANNYNHTTCSAGEDTRGRLSVKNVGNTWLWHCYNCGESGYYRPKEVFSKLIDGGSVTDIHASGSIDPTIFFYTLSGRYDDFTTEQKLWLASYGFFEEEVVKIGLRTNAYGVHLPVLARLPTYVRGYQVRNMSSKGPKYLTNTANKISLLGAEGDVVVVVEDLLSSYKVWLAGYTSAALMGTKLHANPSELPRTSECVVWLDADSAGTTGAMNMVRELNPLYDNVTLYVDRQPKELSIEEIQNVLRH